MMIGIGVGVAFSSNSASAGGAAPDAPTLTWTLTSNGLRANGVAPESLNPAITLDDADFVFSADTGSVPAISSIGYATTTLDDDTVQVDFATPFYAVQDVTVGIPAGVVEDLAGNPLAAVVDGPVDNGSDVSVGVSGFSTASTGSRYERNDSGAALQVAASMTIVAMIRVDALPAGSIEYFFGKGNDWRMGKDTLNKLIVSQSGSNTLSYQLTSDDVGKTLLVGVTRSAANGSQLFIYRVGDRTAVRAANSITSAPTPTTDSAAIGAYRGAGGIYECPSFTIIGVAFSNTTELSPSELTAYFAACDAAKTIVTSMPGVVSAYRAPLLETDLVGSSHMTKIQAGGALTASNFTPEFRDDGEYRLWLWLGQSNAKGQMLLSTVPDYSGTGGIDYTAPTADAQLTTNGSTWTDLQPLGDNNWAGEISFGRYLVANGEANPARIFKWAAGGSSMVDNWNVNDPENPGSLIAPFVAAYPRPAFVVPVIAGVLWRQGESDALDSGDAAAYQASLETLIDWFTDGRYNIADDFIWVCCRLPAYQGLSYRTIVNAAFDAVATARANVVTVNTDNATDSGDGIHDGPLSLIQTGIAAEAAWRTATNQVQAADVTP